MIDTNVEVFKFKIHKIQFGVLVLVKDLWTWTTIVSKSINFAKD
jgi:hypothetical protein